MYLSPLMYVRALIRDDGNTAYTLHKHYCFEDWQSSVVLWKDFIHTLGIRSDRWNRTIDTGDFPPLFYQLNYICNWLVVSMLTYLLAHIKALPPLLLHGMCSTTTCSLTNKGPGTLLPLSWRNPTINSPLVVLIAFDFHYSKFNKAFFGSF